MFICSCIFKIVTELTSSKIFYTNLFHGGCKQCTKFNISIIVSFYFLGIQTKGFFIRKTVMSKCLCGDCFGFHAKDALEFAGITSVTEQQLKQFVRNAKKGCCGRLTFQGRGQISGCIHIQRNALSKDLLATLDASENRIE